MVRKNIRVEEMVFKNSSKDQFEEIIAWAEKEVLKHQALIYKFQLQMDSYEKFLKEEQSWDLRHHRYHQKNVLLPKRNGIYYIIKKNLKKYS